MRLVESAPELGADLRELGELAIVALAHATERDEQRPTEGDQICPAGVGVATDLNCGPGMTNHRYNGDTTVPYSGAEIWGMSSTNVSAGPGAYADDTIQSDIDLTQGQSGSALWFELAPNDRRVVGVTSIHRSTSVSPWNGFSRFTAAKYNWLAANSAFPEDTL